MERNDQNKMKNVNLKVQNYRVASRQVLILNF